MVISLIPDKKLFERRMICLPEKITWQFEVRLDYWELADDEDEESEDYSEYGLYLTSSDGIEACIFHSQSIESEIYSLSATDEDIQWLFDHLLNEIGFRVAETMSEGKQLAEIGSVIDMCMEDWTAQLTAKAKANPTEKTQD